MSVEVDFSGLDKQFMELAKLTQSGGQKAAKSAAELVSKKLKENTPYDPETEIHLRDDIQITKINALPEYDVHYGKKTAWRSNFVNDGTIHIEAQHFKERTVDESQEDARKEMQRVMDEELNGI